jgi:hypothetical protein
MWKPMITAAALALGSAAWPEREGDEPALEFLSTALCVEYDVTAGEAVLLFEAECEESLGGVEVRTPDGQAVLALRASPGPGLSEFRVSSEKMDLAELLDAYPQGDYHLRARASDGRTVHGGAQLSLGLLAAPIVQHPSQGEADVPVTNLDVRWVPDPRASRYRIVLEQNENDGLTVEMPGTADSFRVPDGVLAPGTRTRLEVGAIGRNGNCTLVEVQFRTL